MISTNVKRAVGVFSSHQAAENALQALRDSGFVMNHVSIVAKDANSQGNSNRIGDTRVQDLDEATHIDEGAKTGATAGGTVGGLTGLLVGLGTLAIPGVGPIMLAGVGIIFTFLQAKGMGRSTSV